MNVYKIFFLWRRLFLEEKAEIIHKKFFCRKRRSVSNFWPGKQICESPDKNNMKYWLESGQWVKQRGIWSQETSRKVISPPPFLIAKQGRENVASVTHKTQLCILWESWLEWEHPFLVLQRRYYTFIQQIDTRVQFPTNLLMQRK